MPTDLVNIREIYIMLYKSTLFIIGVLLFISLKCNAQYDKVWAFGDSAGVDFSSNPPVPIKTGISTTEGCATICDDNGQLLFYTDGTYVWNKNHQVMPNGSDLVSLSLGKTRTYSTAQAAIIVPLPGSNKMYYVFSLTHCGLTDVNASELYYSLVDMTLDKGNGDVVAAAKGILLDKGLQERMVAVSDDNCNIWLLNTSFGMDELKARNIGIDGLDTVPVISKKSAGIGYGGLRLVGMDISPDRSKLAITQGNLALYDFDVHSGRISNERVLDDRNAGYYSVAFSPDNTKLYANNMGKIILRDDTSFVFQFDVSTGNASAIGQSSVGLETIQGADTMRFGGALKRAPDGKIYLITGANRSLGVINRPNLPGLNCDIKIAGLSLLPGTNTFLGLPTPLVISRNNHYSSRTDTVFCADSFLITAGNPSGTEHIWEDGNTGESRQVYHSGTYWVRYKLWNQKCEVHVDTFHVNIHNIPKYYTTTIFTGKCQADTFTMIANNLNQTHYLWEDGVTTGKTRKISKSGIYWVSYLDDSACVHYVDTFIVTYPEKDYEVSFNADTLICENEIIQFENTSDSHFNSFTWLFGNGDTSLSENPSYSYTKEGNYLVQLVGKIDGICPDTAYKTIVVDAPLQVSFTVMADSICIGNNINFHHQLSGNTISNLHWNFGNNITQSSTDNIVPHAFDRAGTIPVTLSARFRACPSDSFTKTVYIFDLPVINLGSDNGLCINAAPLYLKNLAPAAVGSYHYLWNTGDTTPGIQVKHPGTYSLTLSSGPLGCSSTESVTITKDCYIDIPNAFTPNGDGLNDYFFPRQLLSRNITAFKMQVFNRWGQAVFETYSWAGRGWDGRLNGRLQPEGVYIYVIELTIDGSKNERYQGNVMLMR